MLLTVKQRGRFVATMRFVHVRLMETLAAWVPTTPEMEAKLLFGEHIWYIAEHADALGKRTFELRLPLQHSLRPIDMYVDILETIASLASTPERLASVYDVVLPGIARRYVEYLNATDSLSDAPTVRILERYVADIDRMTAAARSLRTELSSLARTATGWTDAWREREIALSRIVAEAADREHVEA